MLSKVVTSQMFKQMSASTRAFSTGLNQFYIPNRPEEVKFTPKSNKPKGMAKNHRSEPWTIDEI